MFRTFRVSAVLIVATVVFAGCAGGPPKIAEVRSCLEKVGLEVNDPMKDDKFVESGVFATTKVGDSKVPFAFAMAAVVPKKSAQEKFLTQSKEYLQRTKSEGKLDFSSGIEGDYVWVAGGEKGADTVNRVRKCVKP